MEQTSLHKELQMKKTRQILTENILTIASKINAFAGPVNVNTAEAETISAEVQVVGITKAIAIVEYRKANGPFKSVDDLALVKGIGERTVELNRKNILLDSTSKK